MFDHNYPYYELPQIESLPQMVKRNAEERAEDIAFAWFDGSNRHTVTYKKYLEDVCQAARKTETLAGTGSHIGIIGENSYEWLVIYMAILFSGNIAVVFDKDMEEAELRDVADRMDLSLMAADAACRDKSKAALDHLEVQSFEECLQGGGPVRSPEDFRTDDPDAVCCIFLTSGTTGKRKGVMLSHRNIAADINGSCKLFEPSGVTLAVLPFHHAFGLIAAVWMIFNCGITVYLSKGLRRIQKELLLVKPQTMMLVPLFVETFDRMIRIAAKRNIPAEQAKQLFGGNLEYIICGGAPLDVKYVKEFRRFGIELLNGYGTTECAPVAAVNRNHFHRDGTVGLQVPGSAVKISEEGEVVISGDLVMTGYYNAPEETAEVLKDGWYYTGDLGEIDEDGFITLTGRKKNLIILSSGENISPEELEGKLLHLEGIDEVIVSAEKNELAAEIFSKDADDEAKETIRAEIDRLNKKMPMYKRISRIVFREEEFPKTTSQKIIRRTEHA